MQVVLNRSIASGLGRPDLIAGNVQSQAVVGAPPVATSARGRSSIYGLEQAVSGGGGMSIGGPALGLIVLIAGMGAFIWWVHPHLA